MGLMEKIDGNRGKIYLKGEIDFQIDRFLSNGLSERTSPEFELIPIQSTSLVPPPHIYCRLVVYPNGDSAKSRGKISGFVRFSKLPVDFLVEIWMELVAADASWTSNMNFRSQGERSWGCESLAERKEVVQVVEEDEVRVKCVVEVFGGMI